MSVFVRVVKKRNSQNKTPMISSLMHREPHINNSQNDEAKIVILDVEKFGLVACGLSGGVFRAI
jgi:hypothetical protein